MLDSKEPSQQRNEQETSSQTNFGVWGSIWLFVWDFLKVFFIALAIIIPVRFYLFQPFIVTGQSMEPNFADGEYLIIDEISYRFGNPQRGEVTVIRSPQDPSQFFIKRIIGLPGETVQVTSGQIIIKNQQQPQGIHLQEDYLADGAATFGNLTVALSQDQFFVLGDNRLASSDSRVFGPVERRLIVGRVFFRAFPFHRFDRFITPQYQF